MTRKNIYLIVQALLCAALTVILSLTAADMFVSGMALRAAGDPFARIYSAAAVSEKFSPIAPLFFICGGMAIAGLILNAGPDETKTAVRDPESLRDFIVSGIDAPSPAMKKERRKQTLLFLTGWILFVICMMPIFIHVISPENFPSDRLEEMFSALMRRLLPFTAIGIAIFAVTSYLGERSMIRETEAAKALTGRTGIRPGVQRKNNRIVCAVRIIIAAAAAAMMMAGIANGGMRDVLIKAVSLCTECVGLG